MIEIEVHQDRILFSHTINEGTEDEAQYWNEILSLEPDLWDEDY